MKIAEIRAIAPLADVYELRPDAKYIVIIDLKKVDITAFNGIGDTMEAHGLTGGMIGLPDPSGVQIFEFGAKK